MTRRYSLVLIGSSVGGLDAIRELIAPLPPVGMPPVVVIQHRHRLSDMLLTSLLQDRTRLRVTEAEDKMPIDDETIYIAPADYHLLIDAGHFALNVDEPVHFSRPSIDVSFASAADSYGDQAVGVMLTGANADGAAGLQRIADRGGLAVVQDPATAVGEAMPAAALRAVPSARVLTIPGIVELLIALADGDDAPEPSEAAGRRTPPNDEVRP